MACLTTIDVKRGRAAADRRDWRAAYTTLKQADQANALEADDLETLATAAFLLGRLDECLAALQRAYQRHTSAGASRKAMRCAIWLVFHLANRGDVAQAGGWLARAKRLLEHEPEECVEHAYMLAKMLMNAAKQKVN